jgi:hypothetical protein
VSGRMRAVHAYVSSSSRLLPGSSLMCLLLVTASVAVAALIATPTIEVATDDAKNGTTRSGSGGRGRGSPASRRGPHRQGAP